MNIRESPRCSLLTCHLRKSSCSSGSSELYTTGFRVDFVAIHDQRASLAFLFNMAAVEDEGGLCEESMEYQSHPESKLTNKTWFANLRQHSIYWAAFWVINNFFSYKNVQEFWGTCFQISLHQLHVHFSSLSNVISDSFIFFCIAINHTNKNSRSG